MKAFLKNYRQSPRKVRLVAGLVRGKGVAQATVSLDFLAKRAGLPIKKLLLSAVANAKQLGIDEENLFIKEIRVDKGITMKRMMPSAMGSGHKINKRTSHLYITLGEKGQSTKKTKKATKKDVKVEASEVKEVKETKKPKKVSAKSK